jgi:hypothetical protein
VSFFLSSSPPPLFRCTHNTAVYCDCIIVCTRENWQTHRQGEKKEDASTVSLSQRANHIYPVTSAAHNYLLIFLFFFFVLFKNYQMCNGVTRYTFEEKKRGNISRCSSFSLIDRCSVLFHWLEAGASLTTSLLPRSYKCALAFVSFERFHSSQLHTYTRASKCFGEREREKKRKRCIMNDDSQLGNYAHNDLNEEKG